MSCCAKCSPIALVQDLSSKRIFLNAQLEHPTFRTCFDGQWSIYIYNPLFFLQRSDLLGPGCRFCFLFVLKVLSEWLSSIELRQVLQNILSTFRNSTCVAPMPKPSDLRWGGLDSTLGGSWVASMGWRGKPKGRPDFWCWIFLGIWSQVVSIL